MSGSHHKIKLIAAKELQARAIQRGKMSPPVGHKYGHGSDIGNYHPDKFRPAWAKNLTRRSDLELIR